MFQKEVIHTENAPKAVGTYSQAIKVGNLIFASGQIPLNPETGELVQDSFQASAEQVFNNLTAVCKAAGGDLSNIVKLNVFLTDLNNFAEFNAVMAQFFAEPYPARSAVQVCALPKGATVEAEAIIAL